jgi:hypothetical protein
MRSALTAVAAAGVLAAVAATPAQAKPRDCGAIDFSGTSTRIVVLRGVSCSVAKEVAHHFAVTSGGPQGSSGWSCFLAHAPFRKVNGRKVGFTCRKGRAHTFVGTVASR